jgi:hypothetical protein
MLLQFGPFSEAGMSRTLDNLRSASPPPPAPVPVPPAAGSAEQYEQAVQEIERTERALTAGIRELHEAVQTLTRQLDSSERELVRAREENARLRQAAETGRP